MIRFPALSYYAIVLVSPLVLQPTHARAERLPEPPTRPSRSSSACCLGNTGNIDCSPGDGVDIADLTALIDNLFISFTPLCCPEEANCDGTGGVDIGDLTALIDNLFISFTPTFKCAGGAGAGDIIITEIMMDPAQILDADGEWFEVYNTTTDTVNLYGMTVTGSNANSFFVDANLKVPPHTYRTFGASESAGFLPDYIYSGVSLPNTSGRITLSFGSTVVDEVIYSSGTSGFPTVTPGKSFSLKATAFNATDNDSGANWCLDGTHIYVGVEHGTPRTANTPCP